MKISVVSAKLLESTSAANVYLNNDGLIDVAKFQALQKKIDAAAKKAELTKPSGVYCVLKKLPVKFSAAMFKKADHKYMLSRAIEVKKYARMPKVTRPMILVSYDGLPAALNAEIKKAISAIVQHNKKAPKQKEGVKTEKAKIRDANAKDFDKNLDYLLPQLAEIGIAEKNIFVGQGMFGGKQVFVTLPNKGVITIGASNPEALKKAKANARKAAE